MHENTRRPGALLHTAQVMGRPVRFFRSPAAGEDLPWHSIQDLARAIGLPRAVADDMVAKLKRDWADSVRTVSVAGKSVLIGPHQLGQGVTSAHDDVAAGLDRSDEFGGGPLFSTYVKACGEANTIMNMMDGLTPVEAVSRTIRAATRGEAGHVH